MLEDERDRDREGTENGGARLEMTLIFDKVREREDHGDGEAIRV